MDSLTLNMKTILKGIYNILDKNHIAHTRMLKKLLEEKSDIMGFSEDLYDKKIKYEKYIKESNEMLEVVTTSEKTTIEQLYEISEKYNNTGIKGLYNDIEKSHIIDKMNTDLSNIKKIKEDVVKTLIELKTKRDDTMLTVDKIMFDNSVMLDAIFRNFILLREISKTE